MVNYSIVTTIYHLTHEPTTKTQLLGHLAVGLRTSTCQDARRVAVDLNQQHADETPVCWLRLFADVEKPAVRDAGLDSVPVRYSEFDDELAEREALIEFNRQRDGQIVNEFEEMLEIEQEKAKEREKEAGRVGGKGSENFHDPSQGRAKDKAAEKVNTEVSGPPTGRGRS